MKAALSEFATTVLADGYVMHKAHDRHGSRSGACGKSIAASQQQRMVDALVSLGTDFLTSTFAQVPGLAEKEHERATVRAAGDHSNKPITWTSAKLGDRRLCDIAADYLRSRTVKQFVRAMAHLTGDFDCKLFNQSEF